MNFQDFENFFEMKEIKKMNYEALSKAGLIQKAQPQPEMMYTCEICYEEVDKAGLANGVLCGHFYCKECLMDDIEMKINEKKINIEDFKCPMCGIAYNFRVVEEECLWFKRQDLLDKFYRFSITETFGERGVICPKCSEF